MSEGSMTPSGVFNAISALRGEVNAGFNTVYEKIDAMNRTHTDHELADLREQGEINTRLSLIEEKIADASGPGKAGWSVIGLGLGTGIVSAIKAFFFTKVH